MSCLTNNSGAPGVEGWALFCSKPGSNSSSSGNAEAAGWAGDFALLTGAGDCAVLASAPVALALCSAQMRAPAYSADNRKWLEKFVFIVKAQAGFEAF